MQKLMNLALAMRIWHPIKIVNFYKRKFLDLYFSEGFQNKTKSSRFQLSDPSSTPDYSVNANRLMLFLFGQCLYKAL